MNKTFKNIVNWYNVKVMSRSLLIQKYVLSFLCIICFPALVEGKKLDSLNYTNHTEFFLHWDNDMFLFKDYYYTQGAHFYLFHPRLRNNPANHFLIRLKNADNYYGLGVIQEIYTPKDVADTLLSVVDRPYAGTLYFRSVATSSKQGKKLRLTSEFDLGILGPLSGASQAQRYIHEWLNIEYPKGWDFQIRNRPYLNYNIKLEKGLASVPGIFDFTGTSVLRVGTIHDDMQLGGLIRLGRINSLFKGLNLGNKSYSENRDYQWFIYGGGRIRAVLYNATLMGGIIPPKDFEEFRFNEIKHVVGQLNAGLRANYKFVGIQGSVTWKTPEFENGEQHGWGTISLFLRF